VPDPADEGRHDPGPDRWWNESWYFDFAAIDASVGGYVRLGLYPNQKVAWWWAYLTGADRPLVALRAHDVDVPRTGTEIRTDGIWASLTPESLLEHWSVGLESFAVIMDDPVETYRGERGDRVAFGLDLEWEAVAPAFDYPGTTRYEQSCRVHGEILLGDDRIDFDGPGQRDHSWGNRDWWRFGWCWTAGWLDDGTRYHGASIDVGPDVRYAPGYVVAPDGGLTGLYGWEVATELGPEGLPWSASMQLGSLDLAVEPVGLAPVLLVDGARVSRFPRALCQVTETGGRRGVAWTEWNQPQG
jgi:hypothetical protein